MEEGVQKSLWFLLAGVGWPRERRSSKEIGLAKRGCHLARGPFATPGRVQDTQDSSARINLSYAWPSYDTVSHFGHG